MLLKSVVFCFVAENTSGDQAVGDRGSASSDTAARAATTTPGKRTTLQIRKLLVLQQPSDDQVDNVISAKMSENEIRERSSGDGDVPKMIVLPQSGGDQKMIECDGDENVVKSDISEWDKFNIDLDDDDDDDDPYTKLHLYIEKVKVCSKQEYYEL